MERDLLTATQQQNGRAVIAVGPRGTRKDFYKMAKVIGNIVEPCHAAVNVTTGAPKMAPSLYNFGFWNARLKEENTKGAKDV